MRLTLPCVLAPLLALAACPDNSKGTDPGTTGEPTSTSSADATTQTPPPTSSATDPTSTGSTTAATTEDPGTTAATSVGSTSDATTTGGLVPACVDYLNENACEFDSACNWVSVFQFSRGAQGCQADVIDFCVDDDAGAPSTWYRGENGDFQVVQFEYTPDSLPPEWKLCDCDGPLACFCSFNAPECPERAQEFCDAAKVEIACNNSAINASLRCEWADIDPQGPKDDMCSQQNNKQLCLAVDMADVNNCMNIDLDYDTCGIPTEPTYWRDLNGVIEIMQMCGPVPPSPEWTLCEAVDTPDQPDECKCKCL